MAFSLPWSLGCAKVTNWSLLDNREEHESPITKQTQVEVRPGARWACEIQLEPMRPDAAQRWFAALVRGLGEAFYLSPPQTDVSLCERLSGVSPGVPVVNGGDQSGVVFQTRAWPSEYEIPAGQYFELVAGGYSSLHLVQADAQADGAGQAGLTVYPPIRNTPANGAALRVNAPRAEFRLTGNRADLESSRFEFERVRLSAVEWLR